MSDEILTHNEGEYTMVIRYSDLTIEQLRTELGKVTELAQKAEQFGEISQLAVHERKIQMIASYMLNPAAFKPLEVYELRGDPGHQFKINYIDGVMAWGHRVNLLEQEYANEEALPIALLGEKVKPK